MKQLKQKIKNTTAKIGIVGLGYVGLPVGLAFAEAGFKVLGFDIQEVRVAAINQGESYISDVDSKRLYRVVDNGNLQATLDQKRLKEMDCICICVPTPITSSKEPDLSYVVQESEKVSKHLRSQQLIILESTTYPGVTEEIVLPILERSGLKGGTDFYLAYSPERIDPGNKRFAIKNTPKIVAGIDQRSCELAKELYSCIAEVVVTVSSAKIAEMAKVFENVFRNVNIALVNELSQLCARMGTSVWEVIDAASTKPFGYMPFYPGPGVGGHCIPIDPFYLASKAREYDFHTRFIELAVEINEDMPYYVVSRILEILNARGKSLNCANVLVLGITYKKNIEDTRESPSLKLVQLLNEKGAKVSYNDPYIPKIKLFQGTLTSVELSEEILSATDCVVIATDHSCYNMDEVVAHSRLVFDTRGVTKGLKHKNIFRLGE